MQNDGLIFAQYRPNSEGSISVDYMAELSLVSIYSVRAN